MGAKELLYRNSAMHALLAGVNALSDAVALTLGPQGRHVMLERKFARPLITRDGKTVAGDVEPPNHFADMGSRMVRQAAAKTGEVAGDGTTTATVLTRALFREGAALVAAGHNPMDLKRSIDASVAIVVDELRRMAQPVRSESDIAHIAAISANNDETIGRIIAQAVQEVGRDGVIKVEEATGMESTLELVDGLQFDRGYLSSYFLADPDQREIRLEDSWILLCAKEIHLAHDLLPALKLAAQAGRPLCIIAADVDGQALATLVVNSLRGTLQTVAVKAPGHGDLQRELLEDLAVLTGGTVIDEATGTSLQHVADHVFGSAETLLVDRDHTTVVSSSGDREALDRHTRALRHRIESSDAGPAREELQRRLAQLSGKIAILRMGAVTETEMKEQQARVENALAATRAAIEEGIVPGGGVAYLRALPALRKARMPREGRFGRTVVLQALEEPLRQIARNAGVEDSVVAERVKRRRGPFGFNARTGVFEDLLKAGVIDPVKVSRLALINAASIAGLLLTTACMVARAPEKHRPPQPAPEALASDW